MGRRDSHHRPSELLIGLLLKVRVRIVTIRHDNAGQPGLPLPVASVSQRFRCTMAAALICAAALALSSCSKASHSEAVVATIRATGADESIPQLPVSVALGFDPSQRRLLRRAEDILISECMTGRGFSYVTVPADETDPLSLRNLYGSLSISQAEAFGYRNPDAVALARIEAAALVSESKAAEQGTGYYSALFEGANSCTESALLALYDQKLRPAESAAAIEMLSLAGESQQRIAADPRLGDAVDRWKECMSSGGYDVQVLSDSRMRFVSEPTDISPPSDEERQLAVTDAQCRSMVGIDRLIVAIYAEALSDLLESRPGLEDELTSTFGRAESRARTILDTKGD